MQDPRQLEGFISLEVRVGNDPPPGSGPLETVCAAFPAESVEGFDSSPLVRVAGRPLVQAEQGFQTLALRAAVMPRSQNRVPALTEMFGSDLPELLGSRAAFDDLASVSIVCELKRDDSTWNQSISTTTPLACGLADGSATCYRAVVVDETYTCDTLAARG